MIATLNTTTILSVAGPLIVGLTFISSGVIKAIAPHVFQTHLSKLGWISWTFIPASVVAAAAAETGWGVALIFRTAPAVMIPLTVAALVVFTAITVWSVKSGRTTDCGCYGGYVVPSMAQSVAMNGVFVLLLLLTPLQSGVTFGGDTWKIIVALVAAIASGGLALAGLRTLAKTGAFLINTSPLQIGRAWRSRWGTHLSDDGEHLISFLGPDCPHCKSWVRVLNVVYGKDGLPSVDGVVATTNEKLQEFVDTSGIRFPVHMIPQTLMNRLVYGVPTTVLVTGGRIVNTWSGNMPPEFYNRFRDAYFPPSSVLTASAASAPSA
ncbi:MAG TPA: MauE/DoxX family redox-associated membrane protein [Gemmatimonadaceae bacterium]|nr:MauE/DoxX family redox-associated membrane protein [Gemmatimonadaceae bacterium]